MAGASFGQAVVEELDHGLAAAEILQRLHVTLRIGADGVADLVPHGVPGRDRG
jgi:hypothetical protein